MFREHYDRPAFKRKTFFSGQLNYNFDKSRIFNLNPGGGQMFIGGGVPSSNSIKTLVPIIPKMLWPFKVLSLKSPSLLGSNRSLDSRCNRQTEERMTWERVNLRCSGSEPQHPRLLGVDKRTPGLRPQCLSGGQQPYSAIIGLDLKRRCSTTMLSYGATTGVRYLFLTDVKSRRKNQQTVTTIYL